jgi:2-methylisocitrate lyase-like PEP mutase family enzyme
MLSVSERAERFRALHRGPSLFVLPNAWDVPSARVFEDAGFAAIATSSAGVMVSLGYRDGEEIPREEYVAAVRRIAAKLAVPLSADVVAGFGTTPAEAVATVRSVVEAGAVGINLEDQDPRTETLIPLAVQLEKLRAIRRYGEEAGVPVVVNARTDALWKGGGSPEDRRREAVLRCRAFREAGADCVYPMRLAAREEIAAFVRDVPGPSNVMIRPGLPPLGELERIGIRRVSFGPSASYAAMGLLRRIGAELRADGSFRSLVEGAITFDELNRLAERRDAASAAPR